MESLPSLDASSVQYPFPLPMPYKCPREESCNGGLDSPCESGYEGPLCEVCSSGCYKQLQRCEQCPSKKWIVGQLSIIAIIALIIIIASPLIARRMKKGARKRPLVDTLFSKLKIVIGFYQVTYGLLQAFSYIKWPGTLQVIAQYSEILQMDVYQMASIHCLFSGFRVNAFGSLFTIMTVNAAVIGFSATSYGVRKVIILRSPSLQIGDKSKSIAQTKEMVFRNLFFFLYVTYLSTCIKTANGLPFACQKLCRDEKEEYCSYYMKADYSIQCQGTSFNHWLILAYVSAAYIFVLPLSSFVVLWRQRRFVVTAGANFFQDSGSGMEIISGLCFLFENYNHCTWYWELVEMSRKVILTSGLILVGQESRSYISLAWVIAGMYGVLFSWMKPFKDATENILMATSLAVTVVNLGIGVVSRIPAESISATDSVLFKVLVLGANTLVIDLLVSKVTLSSVKFTHTVSEFDQL